MKNLIQDIKKVMTVNKKDGREEDESYKNYK
jgi:hypothetical protein